MNNIQQKPTDKFTKGRGGKPLEYIVMHWSVTNNIEGVDREIFNTSRQMSYHYCIDNDEVVQYVDTENTAWHAGVFDINQRSIGICIVAGPNNPYTDKDYETASRLIAEIWERYGIKQITGHKAFKQTECPSNLNIGRLLARALEILDLKDEPKPEPQKEFWVRVEKPLANVREKPTTGAKLSGSKTLKRGDEFLAVDLVEGEKVSGNNLWFKSKKGNYVWSYGLKRK